jgi:monoamine oxidase
VSHVSDVIVIGAGIAGVTAARALTEAGLDVTVVEARDRIGGRIHSIRDFCELPVEAGAEFIHGLRADTWPDVRAAGLGVRPCPLTRHTMFNLGGKTRWLPWILLHPGVWRSFPILHWLANAEPPDRAARAFLDEHRLRGRARLMAQMVLTAHLPGTVDEVGILGLLEDHVLDLETALNHRVEEGYDLLPHYIARDLEVRRGFEVAEIRWEQGGVSVAAVDGREVTARAAVCTLPFGVLAAGDVRFIPKLPETKTGSFAHIKMGPVFKVLLRFSEPFWPKWMANLPCAVGPVTLYWPVFYGRAGESPPVLIAYATGARAARFSAMSEAEATGVAVDDLKRQFPRAEPRRLLQASRCIDWAVDPHARGGYTFVLPGGTGARTRLAAADTGALFWAGSATVTSPIAASVHGGFASGLRAASEITSFLQAGSASRLAAAGNG